jgi:hypothetical protein
MVRRRALAAIILVRIQAPEQVLLTNFFIWRQD